jgi:predicted TIM-barrel fold metal-dependent hydrolase
MPVSDLRVDVHQHVWTPSLLSALLDRRWLPFVRRSHGLTVLHAACERPYVIDLDAEAREPRAALLDGDRLDLAVVALSSPIGIELLPRREAEVLIDAFLDGLDELGPRFAAWGPLALDRLNPDDVERRLARGSVGVSLPAQALACPDMLEALSPVLRRLAETGAPLFVHPGPPAPARSSLTEPLWWSAVTDYVAQMQRAWLTFAAFGRREHPELDVVFALLAGGAPLLAERLEARGGPPIDIRDSRTFYEVSSYGPSALEGMARRVGPDQLVYGSDRPVIEPVPTGREALLQASSARLLAPGLERIGYNPDRVTAAA